MNGDWLAIGAVGALALAGLAGQRGSAAIKPVVGTVYVWYPFGAKRELVRLLRVVRKDRDVVEGMSWGPGPDLAPGATHQKWSRAQWDALTLRPYPGDAVWCALPVVGYSRKWPIRRSIRGSRAPLEPVVGQTYVLLRDGVNVDPRKGEWIAEKIVVRSLPGERTTAGGRVLDTIGFRPHSGGSLRTIHMMRAIWPKYVRPYPGDEAWRRLELYDLGRDQRVWKQRRSIRGSRNKKADTPDLHVSFTNLDKEQLNHVFEAQKHLRGAGVSFDTGYSLTDNTRDWEWDWSLSGPISLRGSAAAVDPPVVGQRYAYRVNENAAPDYAGRNPVALVEVIRVTPETVEIRWLHGPIWGREHTFSRDEWRENAEPAPTNAAWLRLPVVDERWQFRSLSRRRSIRGSRLISWNSDWWLSPHKRVRVFGAAARVYKVGTRFVLVWEEDFDGRTLTKPWLRWTFQVKDGRVDDLRMTKAMEREILRNTRHGWTEALRKARRTVEQELNVALAMARRGRT